MTYANYSFKLTLLWWIEAGLQAVEELIKAQLPVSILIRELNEGIDAQAPGRHKHTRKHRINICCDNSGNKHRVEMVIDLEGLIP